ncbi:HAD family phosphatase [Uliginosibacterium sp. 31-16]|uniref:HAD family hydrolase n=1 Tax=Uliginosibacterium sp. 31-16 TaxID=3068315 RepID=UPI00273F7424|nr:HAD family phosphatase [Uliginosibacterium sp. 31-16]MDP5238555.1 HAD family phosphatase [Uliginosibacterium sp. 31-16]
MLTLTRPRAVIFDMDGLLLDSERVALGFFEQASRELGVAWSQEVGLSMVGLNSKDSDKLILQAFGADFPIEAHRQRFGELYEAAIVAGDIPLKPFARELLEYLAGARIPCAVATSTRRTRAEAKLMRAHLLQHFQALACGDEVSRGKPAPDIYELAAARLSVEPRDCLALEDSNAGVRAAVSASMNVVMVPDLLKPDADIRRYGVSVLESLKDVLVALM